LKFNVELLKLTELLVGLLSLLVPFIFAMDVVAFAFLHEWCSFLCDVLHFLVVAAFCVIIR